MLEIAINAFAKWAWAEAIFCFILGLLGIFLIKITSKLCKDMNENEDAFICAICAIIIVIWGIVFLIQLNITIKAIISPEAYAIWKILKICK